MTQPDDVEMLFGHAPKQDVLRDNVVEGVFPGAAKPETSAELADDIRFQKASSGADGQPSVIAGGASLSGTSEPVASSATAAAVNKVMGDAARDLPDGILPPPPGPSSDPLMESVRNDAWAKVVTILATNGGPASPNGIKILAEVRQGLLLSDATREDEAAALIAGYVLERARAQATQAELARQGDLNQLLNTGKKADQAAANQLAVLQRKDKYQAQEGTNALNVIDRSTALADRNAAATAADDRRTREAKQQRAVHEHLTGQIDRDVEVQTIVVAGQHQTNRTVAQTNATVSAKKAVNEQKVSIARVDRQGRQAARSAWVIDHHEWLIAGAIIAVVIAVLLILLIVT